jgi:hypothetical protein
MMKLSRIVLTSVALGFGSLMLAAGCSSTTGEERTNGGADENTATAVQSILTACPPETPYHCRQPDTSYHCQLGSGESCATGECPCPCATFCCETPDNSC